MRARYLAFFSYNGTNFRSSEKTWLKGRRNYPDPDSIQGTIELALLKLRSLNYPNLYLSSRTDGGVHALNSSAHFDLDKFGPGIYEPKVIIQQVNKFMNCNNRSIYIRNVHRVPDNFSARHSAKSRTYLFRLGVIKKDLVLPEHTHLMQYAPIEEWKQCSFIRFNDLDIQRFKECAKLFEGYHDFSTFKKFDNLNQHKHNRRLIYSIEVNPGRPRIVSNTHGPENIFDYWDIKICGKGFVHNQIRRMIGTLISVGIGKLEPKDVQVMLQVPSKHSWHTFIQSMPPDGLYLCDVEYDPKDLVYESNSGTKYESSSSSDAEVES